MVTQSWCSGMRLASFSSLKSDLYFYYFVSNGLFLLLQWLVTERVRSRILQTVLPLTLTTRTQHFSCQWRFWNVYAGQMCVPSIQNGLKEHSPMQGGADGLKNPLHSQKTEPPLSITWHLPSCVKSLVPMSAELSEDRLAFASDVCDPNRLRSQEHAASRRAVYSCRRQLSCSQR